MIHAVQSCYSPSGLNGEEFSNGLERFLESEEPQTDWVYADPSSEKWGLMMAQGFANMEWLHG